MCTITAHSLVLMGNLATAQTFGNIGASTGGWSDVGLGVSNSLEREIGHLMTVTSDKLTEALNNTLMIEQEINLVLGASGNSTQGLLEGLSSISLVNTGSSMGSTHQTTDNTSGNSEAILRDSPSPAAVNAAKERLHEEIAVLIQDLNNRLQEFWTAIKPALVQVGRWLESMGTKMQGFIEQFSTTIDKAQKIFDQIMAKVSGAADVKDQMLYHTFNIFDITHKGTISADDVDQVASLYGVTALAGAKGQELHAKYDANNDGELDEQEYSLFVEDESIPNTMSYVLRIFSKKLMQIVGQMDKATTRDGVADTVVQYFQLMAAKNLTKVRWVSDTLTNKSLPIEFSADVFRQLVFQERDPAKLTNLPVGQIITTDMVDLNPDYVGEIVELLADPVFWASQGFIAANQPIVVQQVREWVDNATATLAQGNAHQQRLPPAMRSLLELEFSSNRTSQKHKALTDKLALLTKEAVSKRMRRHQHAKRQARIKLHERVFHSEATRHLFRHLLGHAGPDSMVGASEDTDVTRVIQGGVPAQPETLEFAQRLVNNATRTSEEFQNYSFDYSKTSSNPIDNFANQIQSFVKKVQQFLDLMMSYCTERGIDDLEQQVMDFTEKAEADLTKVVDRLVDEMVANMSLVQKNTFVFLLIVLGLTQRAGCQ